MKKTTQPHETRKKTPVKKKEVQSKSTLETVLEKPQKEVVSAKKILEILSASPTRQLIDSDTGEIINIPKFKTPYNAQLFKQYEKEPGGGKSLTIPDQALTVPQIIKRSQSGMPLHVGYKQAYYEGEEGDLPDLRKLDLAELQKLREEATIRVEQIRYELNKQEHDRQQQAVKTREEKLKEEIKKQLEDQGWSPNKLNPK